MIHPFIFFLDIMIFVLFLLTFIKQIKLQHKYKNLNGLRYHRLAFMFVTGSLLVMMLTIIFQRLFSESYTYYTLDTQDFYFLLFVIAQKIVILIAAIFSFLWFSNSKFRFLKVFDKWI